MKVHYINILLFALPLNVLTYNNNKPSITPRHTHTNRSLCECDLYVPNYDNDSQMKSVMENFNKQAQQRFHEYKKRMQITRQKCKDQCDKEIQKIILKDKLEKKMEQQLTTLETKIDTDEIPTCICKKSIEDKTENFCLNCGKTMGGVAPSWGLVSGLGYVAWTNYVTQTAIQKGIDAGIPIVVAQLKEVAIRFRNSPIDILGMINPETFRCPQTLITSISGATQKACAGNAIDKPAVCDRVGAHGNQIWYAQNVLDATTEGASAANAAEVAEAAKFVPKTTILTNTLIASVVAIVVIILVMVIIYLVLRYRRKKKMKKKLQYIILLEE
ncbi:rifin PIR protein, putative [Plasmodium reichenowi]|uniref:Rifin PIR protein, putative n=1 Tax=Plasmodium reichenowi TaxID=5854 RepID=A0A2P9D4Y3_PLARE|nr:rifin PIR protein, putative [Plasmodium reichenowi]